MAWEVSIALVLRENGAEGTLITVTEVETVGPVPVEVGEDAAAMRAVFLAAAFERARQVVERQQDSLRVKVAAQVNANVAQLEDGTHPMLY